ncbi:MAG: hypothetical protein VX202_09010 [Pseudomonadota bacterium]|nr:hypothetical protein [Pseudomonadota bacterium]
MVIEVPFALTLANTRSFRERDFPRMGSYTGSIAILTNGGVKMPKLPVKGLPSGDGGRLLVRVHDSHKAGIERYDIAELANTENGKSLLVLVLGHNDDDAIFMPYDIRRALDVDKGGELDFSIEKVGKCGKLRWYFTTPDPAVHVPAWIAAVALGLSILGALLGAASLLC